MKTLLETKTAAVAAVPANSTVILFAAVVDGSPTAAQVETARYTLAANLENVGATATSAYLTRFEPVEVNVDADEGLLLTVDATLSKVGPDPIPSAEPEPSALDGDAALNVEDDATSTDETPLDGNAAVGAEPDVAPETTEA